MRINTNVGAITASRNIFVNNMATENSMRKLSSGLKISRAADDAAGLSIANKLRTQSRSLTQAASNAEQGNAMLQIAEGAASTIQRIIERQKELITQKESTGNNSTVSATLGTEIATLQTESARILADADFQGASVFASLTFQVSDSSSNGTVTVNAALTLTSLSASSTLANADTALDAVNSTLANIGAGQNVLDYTVQNLKSAVVNVRAAESTIRDVDMAEEMATFTKNNILTQAAQAMLSQANQGSQNVLQLLR
ncbi:flagellin [Gemmatimonas groenlandica]|uniref:Flagellin n=1 Tax=Gemmatimonas groenlandica TaxID=2732249 RepID=A0A6M4IN45_9BACT|nr:flagellin [Gemmatimonas groenlandica]QJR36434.1 flagellin [Gemmatimonas groenlandica]